MPVPVISQTIGHRTTAVLRWIWKRYRLGCVSLDSHTGRFGNLNLIPVAFFIARQAPKRSLFSSHSPARFRKRPQEYIVFFWLFLSLPVDISILTQLARAISAFHDRAGSPCFPGRVLDHGDVYDGLACKRHCHRQIDQA